MFKQFEELLERLVVAQERQAAALEGRTLDAPVHAQAPQPAAEKVDQVDLNREADEAEKAESKAADVRKTNAAKRKAAAEAKAAEAVAKAEAEAAAEEAAKAKPDADDLTGSSDVELDQTWYDRNLKAPTVALVNSSVDGRAIAAAVFEQFGVTSAKTLSKDQWVEASQALKDALDEDGLA